MDQLIPVINKLQDVFTTVGTSEINLDLPQIVVIGSQSSGKSSVLENIVGRDFLPRGSGIVTRRPLVLQLIHTQNGTEYAEFLHKPSERFSDFKLVRDEITRETDRLTGSKKGISHAPINLKIFSPKVLNLTLVDLPGMTRVPIGDQPTDIEVQIRRMIMTHIEKANAIILAVTAANTDLSNSDALQLAKSVDPEGKRTLGVLTKIDIMDKGTDAYDMLCGKVVPLKMGFVGVINRSQQDIKNDKPIEDALKEEKEFFSHHPRYRSIAHRCGTQYLSKTLNQILLKHIFNCLPELKAKVAKMMQDITNELAGYGDPLLDYSKGALLLQIITRFSTDFREAIEGKLPDATLNELCGGARINYIFNDIFCKCLNDIQPLEGLTMNVIRTAIRNATGPRASLFVPEAAFDLLIKKQINRLEEPSLQTIELIYEELQRILSQLESKDLLRFPVLREKVMEVSVGLLHRCRVPTRSMVTNLIQIELSYINTNHPDFIGGGGAISAVVQKVQSGGPISAPAGVGATPAATGTTQSQLPSTHDSKRLAAASQTSQQQQRNLPPYSSTKTNPTAQTSTAASAASRASDKDRFDCELIQSLIESYYGIVRKNVKDTVPKSIMHFLVNNTKENLQNELVSHLYKESLFDELLEENSDVAMRRKECENSLKVLREANQILNEVRDFTIK